MPTLYLVGTPIGNLEDISLRALRILGEVSLIAAEDTRTTAKLLNRHNIKTPLVSYHDFSTPDRRAELLQTLEQSDVALVSEAGMPGLSDPGFRLIRAALEAGLPVVPIPGPTAAVAALVGSGLPTDRFLFLGFLPRKRQARQAALAEVVELPYTLVLYEAPHRLLAMLNDVRLILGNRPVTIGRELTKMHEEFWRGDVDEALEIFSQRQIRGEFTLVIAGSEKEKSRWDEASVQLALQRELTAGRPRGEAAANVAKRSGWRRREVYDLAIRLWDS